MPGGNVALGLPAMVVVPGFDGRTELPMASSGLIVSLTPNGTYVTQIDSCNRCAVRVASACSAVPAQE